MAPETKHQLDLDRSICTKDTNANGIFQGAQQYRLNYKMAISTTQAIGQKSKLLMSDAETDPWAPLPQEYISRPTAATSSQEHQGTSMFTKSSVPYIMHPPAGSSLTPFPSSYTPPSRNFTFASPGSSSRQSSSHTTSPSRNVSEIIPCHLYISDLSFAENPTLLSSYRITHILSTLPDSIFRPPPSVLPNQPVRMQIELEDTPFAELAAYLPRTTSFIREALSSDPEARVLVHCVEGISRSVSVVAAYLMVAYGWSPKDAVEYIKTKRPVANPNFGFMHQLSEYARDSLSLSNPIHSHLPPLSAPPRFGHS